MMISDVVSVDQQGSVWYILSNSSQKLDFFLFQGGNKTSGSYTSGHFI